MQPNSGPTCVRPPPIPYFDHISEYQPYAWQRHVDRTLIREVVPDAFDSRASDFHYNLWCPAALAGALAAFAGAFIPTYALGRLHVSTTKHGSNTVLRRATPSTRRASSSTPH